MCRIGFKRSPSPNVAAGYQAFRPGYPPALFDGLAAVAPRRARGRTWAAAPGRLRRGACGPLRRGDRPRSERRAGRARRAAPAGVVSGRAGGGDGAPAVRGPRDRRLGPFTGSTPSDFTRSWGASPGGRRVRGNRADLRSVPRRFADGRRRGSPLSQHPRTLLAAGARPLDRYRTLPFPWPDRRTSPGHRGIVDARAIHRVPGDLVRRERLPPEDGRRSARSRGERVARGVGSAGADPKRGGISRSRGARRPRASLGHEDATIASVSSKAASHRR